MNSKAQPVLSPLSEQKNNLTFYDAESNEKASKPCYIPFIKHWKNYFAFGYYLLIIPFRIEENTRLQKFVIGTCLTQQVLCAIVHLILLVDFTSLFWTAYMNAREDSNISYFNSLTYLGYLAYHLCLNYTFWFRRRTFQSLIAKIQKVKLYSVFSARITFAFTVVVSFILYSIVLLMAFTDHSLVNNFYIHGDVKLYYQYLSQTAQHHFLLVKPGGNNETLSSWEGGACLLPKVATILRLIVLLPSLILVPFVDGLVLMVSFTLWRMICAFRIYCKNTIGGPASTERILKKYWMIKCLIRDINRAVGLILSCSVLISLPYYATWSAVTYFKENVHSITLLHVYTFLIIFSGALTLAADMNKKGTEFCSWLASPENHKELSSKTITSLLMDLHANEIALKGNGFFHISYRFLGTIIGIIITYSIITIQVQLSRKGNENVEAD